MIDEAFLRQTSGKFFVGRPSSDARLIMIREIPCWTLEPKLLDEIFLIVTRELTKAMIGKCIERQRHDSTYQTDKIEALEIVDRVAQQYQIFVGSETLSSLLLRNLSADSHKL